MIRLDTGGGALAAFVITVAILFGGIYFLTTVVEPIVCYLINRPCP